VNLGSLPQFLDAIASGPAGSSATSAQSADFSIALSGASTGSPAGPAEGAPLAELAPAPHLQIATLVVPVGADKLDQGSFRTLAAAAPDGKPAVEVSPPQALAEIAGERATATAADAASPNTNPELPIGPVATLAKLRSSPRGGRGFTASPAGSAKASDAGKAEGPQLDPGALTLQQVLAAVASAIAPAVAQQRLSQPAATQEASAALLAGSKSSSPAPAPGAPAAAELLRIARARASNSSEAEPPIPITTAALPSPNPAPMVDPHLLGNLAASVDLTQIMRGPGHEAAPPPEPQGSDLHQLDALLRDIAEVSGTSGRAAIRLTAEQLGGLEIKVHRSDSGINVSIRTDNEQGRSTVVQAQQQLADDMRASGLKLAATSVMMGHSGAERERHDRQPLHFTRPIEAAPDDRHDEETTDELRPDGRYA
jgi:flagellar hook-length control protein FliK